MSSSISGASGAASYGFGVGLAGGASTAVAQQGQGVAALLVMLAVLCFIFAYCCWGAPFCRALCRRHCCCRLEDGDTESGCPVPGTAGNPEQPILATPTIILLPHGRMLVVDGTILTQFQAENSGERPLHPFPVRGSFLRGCPLFLLSPAGLDLVELGESVMRAQRNPVAANRHQHQNSQGSVIDMDAETPSKDSMGSLGCFPPPTYESIYGKEERRDMPPSYSDILLHR
jgi:hypothetical protein